MAGADRAWSTLASRNREPAALFDRATLAHLPAPAERLLRRVLPDGIPLDTTVVLEMEGRIKLGPIWMRFQAEQILCAGLGFVWRPVVGGRVVRFVGADLLEPDQARMEFRLHGRIPVVSADGSDISRSAACRLAGETVMWLPQALAPQAGAGWAGIDDNRAVVTLPGVFDLPDVEVSVDAEGRLLSTLTMRWNASSKPPAVQPFGGPVRCEFETATGVRMAGRGSGGWGWSTPEWERGRFFEFSITAAQPVRSSS